MKLKQIVSMKILIWKKLCLMLVNLEIIQDFLKKKKKVISKMKDESKDALIFGLVGWKSKIFSCIKKDSKEEKSQKELIEILFKIWRMKNTKTRFLRRNEWGTTRKQYTNLRNINLTQCIYHVVMIENKYLMMELKLYYTVIKILINYFD